MSAKLIVEKYDSSASIKSLYITLNGCGDLSHISEWSEGNSKLIKSKASRSSRLVVKISSEWEQSQFDLDRCAQEIDSRELKYSNNHIGDNYQSSNGPKTNGTTGHSFEEVYGLIDNHDKSENIGSLTNVNDNMTSYGDLNKNVQSNQQLLSPLEYSLERVKENNARIMENIQMLNRTLNYTKKKDIFDVIGPKPLRSYPCNICGKCFVYETGLKRHFSMRHSMTDVQPRWQIVWTCVECFQVWPRKDFALNHTSQCCHSDNVDNVREIKTSSLLQCEFCEKVFTSIPRLLKHYKNHSTINNYECNACTVYFSSYKAAEQHWVVCPWLKTCYRFTLPKLLLCNTCDRKFRNYDQLYNHRYKVGHYMTKTHQDLIKSLISYFYQCEMCGQCFSSIPSLQMHKNQSHPQCDIGMQYSIDSCYAKEINYGEVNELSQ